MPTCLTATPNQLGSSQTIVPAAPLVFFPLQACLLHSLLHTTHQASFQQTNLTLCSLVPMILKDFEIELEILSLTFRTFLDPILANLSSSSHL